ncbi:MAG: ABC transporter substrate-binding protein [Hyphomonadaceae bacterium]|nr:ABC transporter substrate-binding protein [Hyphomonadaceae bacterium]
MDSTYAKTAAASVLAGVIGLASYGVVRETQTIGEGRIVVATGSSQYYELAESYRKDLERNGIKLEVQRLTEGFATLRLLLDPKSGVNAGFIKGGLVGSLQGRLATEKAKGRHAEFGKLLSVGRLFYEPIWVYSRGDLHVASLRDLKDKKIFTGTKESGARRIVNQLLKANGIDKTNATLIDQDLPADAAPLFDGRADVAITIAPPDSDKMQELVRVQGIRLMDFSAEAEAYDNRFPALTKVVLRKGSVEFNPVIPSEDITLLATTAALVVRSDMHPALMSLLTHAVVGNPRSGFDKQGDPVLFYRAGEFPSASDPEFTVPADTRAIYKTGELPFLLRFLAPLNARLGVPFSFTAFINSYAAQVLLVLIPLLAVAIPLFKALPAIYVWNVRRKLIYWYRQLKALEKSLDSRGAKYDMATHQAELERIDGAVRRIRVPSFFSNELYDLRMHIDLVRQRLSGRPNLQMAAE